MGTPQESAGNTLPELILTDLARMVDIKMIQDVIDTGRQQEEKGHTGGIVVHDEIHNSHIAYHNDQLIFVVPGWRPMTVNSEAALTLLESLKKEKD